MISKQRQTGNTTINKSIWNQETFKPESGRENSKYNKGNIYKVFRALRRRTVLLLLTGILTKYWIQIVKHNCDEE